MFYKARIKLTLWYLVIIMAISSMFSFVIFNAFEKEIRRFRRPNPEIVEEITQRVLITLMGINGTIFIVSGALGYFLAGKTLKPIQTMLDGQIRFIADASHELRTPLTALRSTFEVFLRNNKESLSSAKAMISESLDEVGKLQLLTESLLQLTTFEKGNSKFEKVNLGEIILDSLRRVSTLAKNSNINIEFKNTKTFIDGDKQSLTNLFTILLDNSIKYSNKNSKVIIKLAQVDGKTEVLISDEGIGISTKDLPHIFDRFYRADSARTKTQKGGYGLGLSIAKKIIEDHNGSINVKSEINKGSTFQVNFS